MSRLKAGVTLTTAVWALLPGILPIRAEAADVIQSDAGPPFVLRGTTMVPLRVVAEWLGAGVEYVGDEIVITQAVSGSASSAATTPTIVRLRVGSAVATVDGEETGLTNAPVLRKGRAYVPLRFVSETLGASVTYDPSRRVVQLRSGARTGELALPTQTGRRASTPDALPLGTRTELDAAWARVQDQLATYRVLDSLSGPERSQAAMKVVTGIEQLKEDLDFIIANAPPGDPRRKEALHLRSLMRPH
jgi:hypothetical protein